MATLAENFLADLDELSEGEEEEQPQQDKGGGVEEDEEGNGNGDDKVSDCCSSFRSCRRALSLALFCRQGHVE